MSDGVTRYPIRVPEWHHKRLVLLAFLKGTNKSTLSASIIQSQIEATNDQISEMLAEVASDRGMTVEELIAGVLSGKIE